MAKKESVAPALARGLTVIEAVAAATEPMAFGHIAAMLGVSNASTSRLLRVLRERDYLRKAKGGYVAGPQLQTIGTSPPLPDALAEKGQPLLVSLSRQTGNTAILFLWSGQHTHCVAKALHEDSLGMQEVGSIRTDTLNYPWGWIILAHASAATQDALWSGPDLTVTKTHVQEQVRSYRHHGFAVDTSRTLRRLAAPVWNADGELVACMALGGTPLSITDEQVNGFAALLIEHAKGLSARLGASDGPAGIVRGSPPTPQP